MKEWVPLTTIKIVWGALKTGGSRLKSPHRQRERGILVYRDKELVIF